MKLTKRPSRANPKSARYRGDGRDQERINKAHAKRVRRAERNRRLLGLSKEGEE